MKIRVEIETPKGDFCHGCIKYIGWKDPCTMGCSLFSYRVHSGIKLKECIASQIKPRQIHSCDIPGCLSCGNPE